MPESRISSILRARVGHDFSKYKEKTMVRRIQRERTGAGDHLRIWVPACVLQIDTVPSYVARLKEDCRTGVRLNLSAVFAQTYFGSERNPAVHVICDGTA
jgi:hypothetical protein